MLASDGATAKPLKDIESETGNGLVPPRFGNWHTIYTRMSRWSKSGVLDKVFEKLQREQLVRIKIEALSLDSTSVKVHPDGHGALKTTDRSPLASRVVDGQPRFI